MQTFDAIARRRSIKHLTEPGPSDDEIKLLLLAADAAPDHGHLIPWEFTVLEGAEKQSFGDVLADAYINDCRVMGTSPTQSKIDKERTKLERAPLVIIAAAIRRPSEKIPWTEQLCAAAAATQNLLLAATDLGYASMWRTGHCAYSSDVKAALGLTARDAIIGFIYLGSALPTPQD